MLQSFVRRLSENTIVSESTYPENEGLAFRVLGSNAVGKKGPERETFNNKL